MNKKKKPTRDDMLKKIGELEFELDRAYDQMSRVREYERELAKRQRDEMQDKIDIQVMELSQLRQYVMELEEKLNTIDTD